MLKISFESQDLFTNDTIVILVNDQLEIDHGIVEIDQKFHGIISKTIQNKEIFQGEFGQIKTLTATDKDGTIKTLIVVGVGNNSTIQEFQIEQIGSKIYHSCKANKSSEIGLRVYQQILAFSDEEVASLIANGVKLAAYKFDKYQTTLTDEEKRDIKQLNILVSDKTKVEELFEEQDAVTNGVYFARDLTNEVPNVLYPDSYAEKIVNMLEPFDVELTVLGEREMQSLGMGALIGVGQGSAKESKLVVMEYKGTSDKHNPIGLVGKGVTFDTGGISLKPSPAMDIMKSDMGGSATVVGTIQALASRKAKVNIVGVVGLVENMPGSNAQRPGDVIKTMSGQTVEILNTDAEGRLVLADCLTYIQEKFNPELIIDIATLTGAIVVSLADVYAGCFSNNNQLANNLIKSSLETNEKLWRMPLHKDYDVMLKSQIADVANISTQGGGAGSSTAAQFLQRFINDTKWAHLDIAAVAWDKQGKNPICPKGGVGFGVRLLNKFIKDNCESR